MERDVLEQGVAALLGGVVAEVDEQAVRLVEVCPRGLLVAALRLEAAQSDQRLRRAAGVADLPPQGERLAVKLLRLLEIALPLRDRDPGR